MWSLKEVHVFEENIKFFNILLYNSIPSFYLSTVTQDIVSGKSRPVLLYFKDGSLSFLCPVLRFIEDLGSGHMSHFCSSLFNFLNWDFDVDFGNSTDSIPSVSYL